MTPRIVRLSLAAFLLTAASSTFAQPPLPTPGSPGSAAGPGPGANPSPGPTAPIGTPLSSLAPNGDDIVSIKLGDADIDAVLSLLELYTGRSILRPGNGLPTAPYSINVKNITVSEAIIALETSLALNQVGVVPLGSRLLKVVALSQVKNEAPLMLTGSALDLAPSGKVATKIFQLEFLRAAEFIAQLQNILTTGIGAGNVIILDKSNAAMITDTVSNLQRVESLLAALDKPVIMGMTPKFYVLRNGAKASDVVNKLRAIITGTLQQQLGTATTFSADDRTNQIILITDSRQHAFFDNLISSLDIKADPNSRNEVIYLKHAKAADVQKLLTTLVQGQNAAAQRSQSLRPGQVVLPGQTQATTPGGPNVPTNVPAPNVTTAQNQTFGLENASNEFSSIINVVNDDRSNAIIVSGTADDVRLIKELVAKVDIVLAQVNIEVIIAEVTLNNTQRSGIQALNLTFATDHPGAPGGDNGRGTHVTNFAGNVAGWAITEGVVNPLAFKAALSDTGSRSNLKILSAPTISTTHGQEGTITVGEKRPIVTGSQSTIASTGTNPVATSQFTLTPITLELKVTPFIGEDGSIQLKIDQKVDDVISFVTIDNNQQPVIGTRQVISNLNVIDGQMRVLGGLQRTKSNRDRTKLGFIYEIPILSHLLGSRTNTNERTELLVFVRPHVVRLDEGHAAALKTIDTLSNKEQVNQYLKDPSVQAKEGLLEKLK
jgi:general secretion pathway protein D